MNRALRALAAAMTVLLLAFAAPVQAASCNGASHLAPQLTNGKANPGSGTTATSIVFSVLYRDAAGCAPTSITVTVNGVGSFNLTGSGGDPTTGITFARSIKLPVGTHSYRFTATSGSGQGERTVTLTEVSPRQVLIAAPAATPAPTPRPPAPTPVPPRATPAPTPAPIPIATPTASAESATPSPSSTPASTATATPEPSSSASPELSPPASAGRRTPQPSPDEDGPIAGVAPPSPAPDPSSEKPPPVIPLDRLLAGPLGQYLVATAAGLAMFLLLVRRTEPMRGAATAFGLLPRVPGWDSAAAAEGAMTAPASRVAEGAGITALPPSPDPAPPVASATPRDQSSAADGYEAGMPRWLRPSVRAARGLGPTRRQL